MSVIDEQRFKDAVSQAKDKGSQGLIIDDRYASAFGSIRDEWVAALHALNRLAMFDMLPALEAITFDDRRWLIWVEQNKHVIGEGALKRIASAKFIVENREIADHDLLEDQVNDGREFLGCTRLDNAGVQKIIDSALNQARAAIQNGVKGTEWATLGGTANRCCGVVRAAWFPILVGQRRVPGASLNSNLAAAAHYMLARFHVCAAKATKRQMNLIIEAYDEKKRGAISNGHRL